MFLYCISLEITCHLRIIAIKKWMSEIHVLSGSYEKSFLIENFKTHTKECNERGRKQTEGEAGQQMMNKARKGRKKGKK